MTIMIPEEMEPCEVLMKISQSPGVSGIVSVFGERTVCSFLEDWCDGCTMQNIKAEFSFYSYRERTVRLLVEIRGFPLRIEEMEVLGLNADDCKRHSIPLEDPRTDAEGREMVRKTEDPGQMKLFPEMESGLPPYRYWAVKKGE